MKTIIPHLIKSHKRFVNVGFFQSSKEILDYLRCNYCDLLFLSVEMSEVDGFAILDRLDAYPDPPLVILTSSETSKNSDRAHLYYSKGMIDFIPKNAGISRAKISLDRFAKVMNNMLFNRKKRKESIGEVLAIGRDSELANYSITQISHVIHTKNYTSFYLQNGSKYTVYMPLKKLEEKLPVGKSVKISRNCVVMLHSIKKYKNNAIHVVDSRKKVTLLPVSVRKRGQIINLLRKKGISVER